MLRTTTLALVTIIAVSACATGDKESVTVRSGGFDCLNQESTLTNLTYTTKWCTSRKIFQPNEHIVFVNSQQVFVGTDFEDVHFERVPPPGQLIGSCTPRIDITDMKTDKPVSVAALPQLLVQECKIKLDERGLLVPFVRDEACSAVYAKELAPLVGKLFPFKRAQECKISIDGTAIFKGTFIYR